MKIVVLLALCVGLCQAQEGRSFSIKLILKSSASFEKYEFISAVAVGQGFVSHRS